jgi:hypothetical protein
VHPFVGADAMDHLIQDSPSLAFDHRLHEPLRLTCFSGSGTKMDVTVAGRPPRAARDDDLLRSLKNVPTGVLICSPASATLRKAG